MMTDEELAKESWWNDDCCSGAMSTEKIYECGFLAGLKAGRPKWHKIADRDYPPCENGDYSINVLTDGGDIAYYNYDDGYWAEEPASVEIDPPIAWCERPIYTEE